MISLSHLHPLLMGVEQPGRYVGGEFGARQTDPPQSTLRVALCFPDLYEIGMSNYALRLLYKMANDIPGVSCERVFAPAPDFREALRATDTPLYTLETRTPLFEMDLIAVSVGYELAATTLIGILESGYVDVRREDRSKTGGPRSPIILGGGPGTANPAPWATIFDGLFVGEAENVFPQILEAMANAKRLSGSREAQLSVLRDNPHVWVPENPQRARRAVWREFGSNPVLAGAPVPSQRVVHDHGVVEIMRGCPQGCRFCSAGVYYRPYRMKELEAIDREVQFLVEELGYREITLSSLSSGDYRDIVGLFRYLNEKYGKRGVSFSLPSLRVNSLTLPVLAEISRVRRSGLTFAVETPTEAGQLSINKLVPLERTRAVLEEAVQRGWKLAKFYFMIGLPGEGSNTPEEIAQHLGALRTGLKVQMNVTVTTFVPKPHTPFQWAQQLPPAEAEEQLRHTKRLLKGLGIKMNYPDPFTSALEGVISRGDSRVGELLLSAHERGCYLDPWDEHFQRGAWESALATAAWDVLGETLRERDVSEALAWDDVQIGVAPAVLRREYSRSLEGRLTEHCAPECVEPCSICKGNLGPKVLEKTEEEATAQPESREAAAGAASQTESAPRITRPGGEEVGAKPAATLLFSFEKSGPAAYLPHLGTMALFERSFQRAGLPVAFTEGYNPKPRLQFAQPLSVGISSDNEVALVLLRRSDIDPQALEEALNQALPEGFRVNRTAVFPAPRLRLSLMSMYWGGDFTIRAPEHLLPELTRGLAEYSAPGPVLAAAGSETVKSPTEELSVRYSQDAASGRGLKKTLHAILGAESYRRLRIHRISSLARLDDGRGGYTDYFSALAASQSFSSSSGDNDPNPLPVSEAASIDLNRR